MLVQRIGAVLRQDIDLLDAGIEQVGEDKIDDLVFSAKGDARFGTTQGQRAEALPFSPPPEPWRWCFCLRYPWNTYITPGIKN